MEKLDSGNGNERGGGNPWDDQESPFEQFMEKRPVEESKKLLNEIHAQIENSPRFEDFDEKREVAELVLENARKTFADADADGVRTPEEKTAISSAVVLAGMETVMDKLAGDSSDPIPKLMEDGREPELVEAVEAVAREDLEAAEYMARDMDGDVKTTWQENERELKTKAENIISELHKKHALDNPDKAQKCKEFFENGRGIKEVIGIYEELEDVDQELIEQHMGFILERAFDQHYDNPEQFVSHGFDHTLNVMKYTDSIIESTNCAKVVMEKYGIDSEAKAKFLLRNVALFHDFGYPASEEKGLGKAAHGLHGANLINYGATENGSLIKDVMSSITGATKKDVMQNDLRDSVLFHSADKVEQTFSTKIITTHGEFLLDHDRFVDVYKSFTGENGVGFMQINVDSAETKEELLRVIKLGWLLDKNQNARQGIKDIEERYDGIIVVKGEKFGGRTVDLNEKDDKVLGLKYSEVILDETPLQAMIRLADNMDMKPDRFSEIQKEPLFLDFIKRLGTDEEIPGTEDTYKSMLAKLEKTSDKALIKQWKESVVDALVREKYPSLDETTINKIKEIAVKQNAESYQHFGGCEAIEDVKIANGRVEITVDMAKFNELNETKVKEKTISKDGEEEDVEVGVGAYQIWRMSEAYGSIRLSGNDTGLPIYVNGEEWSVKS
ncbi:MAG: hypothetical protein LBQ02_03730 [Candidatus Nomurabacteria bacterium]|jgi:hypothetical protein|nr:hypothetical protein [Candidatus Nomurabacteria bacterium]